MASLGEAAEWPARIVLALIRLPEGEGGEAREILVSTLDEWAANAGLAPLDTVLEPADESTELDASSNAIEAASQDGIEDASPPARVETDSSPVSSFDAPIEVDELERAFAEAEAQTDEMLDVNTVAARVLMDEPLGLSEIDDSGPSERTSGEPIDEDAVWAVKSLWPEQFDVASEELEPDWMSAPAAATSPGEAAESEASSEQPSRVQTIATLERWLVNLENQRMTRRAGGAR